MIFHCSHPFLLFSISDVPVAWAAGCHFCHSCHFSLLSIFPSFSKWGKNHIFCHISRTTNPFGLKFCVSAGFGHGVPHTKFQPLRLKDVKDIGWCSWRGNGTFDPESSVHLMTSFHSHAATRSSCNGVGWKGSKMANLFRFVKIIYLLKLFHAWNDTFFNEIDDLEKSRQVWKVFLVFRAKNVLFLCCGKARETKENVFNEVVYIFRGFSGFPKAQKQHIWGPENP